MIVIISLSLFISSFVKAQNMSDENMSDEIYKALEQNMEQAIAKQEAIKYFIATHKVVSITVENEAGESCEIPSDDIGKYTPYFLNPSFSSKSLFDLEKCGDQELAEAELISKTASLHTAGGVQVAVAPVVGAAVVSTYLAATVGSAIGCSIGVMQTIDNPNKSGTDVAVRGGVVTGVSALTGTVAIGPAIAGRYLAAATIGGYVATTAAVITGAISAVVCNKVTLFFSKSFKKN